MSAAVDISSAIALLEENHGIMPTLRLIFGANLRRLMKLRGLKPKDLADQLGVHQSIIGYWRTGDRFPSPENIQLLRAILKVSYDELFREDTDPNPEETLHDADAVMRVLKDALEQYEAGKKKKKKPGH